MGRRAFFQFIFQLLGIVVFVGKPLKGISKPKGRKRLVCWDGGDEVVVQPAF
jgi:hypothetical protein